MIRLVLADDHSIVLDGLKRLFESQSDFEILECCPDGPTAVQAVRRHHPDVLVVDQRMPGLTGLEVLKTLSEDPVPCKAVLLTAAVRDDEVVEAVRLGANGVVLKESSPESLLECARRVADGEQWIDRDTLSRAFGRVLQREAAGREAGKTLTPRELEIVRMIGQGLRNKAIADRMSISEGTVKIHLHNIYEKLGVDGRLELVLYAQAKGLV